MQETSLALLFTVKLVKNFPIINIKSMSFSIQTVYKKHKVK